MSHVVETPDGKIVLTTEALAMLAGLAASECHGVVGLAGRGWQGLGREQPSRGVQVEVSGGRAEVRLGIVVAYGVRIAEVAAHVVARVRHAVEQATGLQVERVRVDVQGIRVERGGPQGATGSW